MSSPPLRRIVLRSVTLTMALIAICFRIGHAEWAQSVSAENIRTPKVFALLASGPNLLVSFESGVFRSSDQGKTWTHPKLGDADNTIVFSLASNGSLAFAGTVNDGIYKSTDFGLTWTQSGLSGEYVTAIALFDSTVLAATCCHGLFRSSDAGVTWTHPLAESIYIQAVAGNAGFFFAGSDTGLYRSSDQGRTWAHFPFAAVLSDSAVGPFAVVGATLFAGSRHGVYHSDDNGGSWVKSPLEATFINAMAATDRELFVATSQGFFQSSDPGSTWVKIDAGLPSNSGYPPYISCLAASGGSLFVGISNAGIWSRPLAELTATLHATKVPAYGKNPGYRRFWETPVFVLGPVGITSTAPIAGVQVDGRALTLRERLPVLPNPR